MVNNEDVDQKLVNTWGRIIHPMTGNFTEHDPPEEISQRLLEKNGSDKKMRHKERKLRKYRPSCNTFVQKL